MRRSNVRQGSSSVGPSQAPASGQRPRSQSGSRVRFGDYPTPVMTATRPSPSPQMTSSRTPVMASATNRTGSVSPSVSRVGSNHNQPMATEATTRQSSTGVPEPDLDSRLQAEQMYLDMLDAQVSRQRQEQAKKLQMHETLPEIRQPNSQDELQSILEKSNHRQNSLEKLNQLLLGSETPPPKQEEPVESAAGAALRKYGLVGSPSPVPSVRPRADRSVLL